MNKPAKKPTTIANVANVNLGTNGIAKPTSKKLTTINKVVNIADLNPVAIPEPGLLMLTSKIKARQAEPLQLTSKGSAKVNYKPLLLARLAEVNRLLGNINQAKPSQIKSANNTSSNTSKTYNRPTKPGSCLTVWEWLDKNPNASKKQAVAALNMIHPTTVQVQFGHWQKAN